MDDKATDGAPPEHRISTESEREALRLFLREHEVACQIRMQWECRVGSSLDRLQKHLSIIEEAASAK